MIDYINFELKLLKKHHNYTASDVRNLNINSINNQLDYELYNYFTPIFENEGLFETLTYQITHGFLTDQNLKKRDFENIHNFYKVCAEVETTDNVRHCAF
jgi:hypothetical protein